MIKQALVNIVLLASVALDDVQEADILRMLLTDALAQDSPLAITAQLTRLEIIEERKDLELNQLFEGLRVFFQLLHAQMEHLHDLFDSILCLEFLQLHSVRQVGLIDGLSDIVRYRELTGPFHVKQRVLMLVNHFGHVSAHVKQVAC